MSALLDAAAQVCFVIRAFVRPAVLQEAADICRDHRGSDLEPILRAIATEPLR